MCFLNTRAKFSGFGKPQSLPTWDMGSLPAVSKWRAASMRNPVKYRMGVFPVVTENRRRKWYRLRRASLANWSSVMFSDKRISM